MKWLGWFTVVFYIAVWRTECDANQFENVHNITSPKGFACVTVSSEMPAGLTTDQMQLWRSSPQIALRLMMRVTRLFVYVTCASQQRVNKDQLSPGSHYLEYQEYVEGAVMKLALSVDGKQLDPLACADDIFASTSHFEQITVGAMGPLYFAWNETCPEITSTPTTITNTTTPLQSTKLTQSPGRSTREATSNSFSNSVLLTSITPNPFPDSSTTPSAPVSIITSTQTPNIINADTPTKIAGGVPFWVWLVGGSGLVVVVLVAVCSCYACSRNRKHKGQMKRRTDAERVKQELLVDAKRMSYQEQMRWDLERVDSGAVPASEEFAFKLTTFSDQK